MKGAAARLRREQNQAAWLAWHIEAFARQKKLPKLKDLMAGGEAKKPRRMTPEQLEAVTRSWLAGRKANGRSSPIVGNVHQRTPSS